jgi:short subunit dehydrogenase-like uncharacterized protein
MRITVIGAYGYTGLLICNELEKRKISFAVAGRENSSLIPLKEMFSHVTEFICVDISTARGIEDVLASADLLINCAGPYNEESADLTQAASEFGKIYLDICGELDFVKNSFNNNNTKAQASGATIVHACAFESLPFDLVLSIILKSIGTIDKLRSFYSFTNSRPSPGTRLTMKLARFRMPFKISQGIWKVSDHVKDKLNISWPQHPQINVGVPYPLPEILFSHLACKPQESASYLLLSKEDAAFVNPLDYNGPSKDEIIAINKKRKALGPKESERQMQEFKITICANNKYSQKECITISGNDMYLSTAKAIAYTVGEIMTMKVLPKGVIRPAQLFVGKEEECLKKLDLQLYKNNDFQINE